MTCVCDGDYECAQGLLCFHRYYGDDNVPIGCSGTPVDDADYCHNPNLSLAPSNMLSSSNIPSSTPSASSRPTVQYPPLEFLGWGPDTSVNKLRMCQGDCDGDYECAQGLLCFSRYGYDNVPIGCSGTPVDDADYCHNPNLSLAPSSPNALPSSTSKSM